MAVSRGGRVEKLAGGWRGRLGAVGFRALEVQSGWAKFGSPSTASARKTACWEPDVRGDGHVGRGCGQVRGMTRIPGATSCSPLDKIQQAPAWPTGIRCCRASFAHPGENRRAPGRRSSTRTRARPINVAGRGETPGRRPLPSPAVQAADMVRGGRVTAPPARQSSAATPAAASAFRQPADRLPGLPPQGQGPASGVDQCQPGRRSAPAADDRERAPSPRSSSSGAHHGSGLFRGGSPWWW